jgi:hypothetical protein
MKYLPPSLPLSYNVDDEDEIENLIVSPSKKENKVRIMPPLMIGVIIVQQPLQMSQMS